MHFTMTSKRLISTRSLILVAGALLLGGLLFSSCSKSGSNIVSSTSLEFTSSSSSKQVTSTSGVILDDIRIGGKDISERSQTSSGDLVITGDWVMVTSPSAKSGQTVHSFVVSVSVNNTSSTREAYVYVHDPETSTIAKIKVTQTCPADEKKESDS